MSLIYSDEKSLMAICSKCMGAKLTLVTATLGSTLEDFLVCKHCKYCQSVEELKDELFTE